MRLWTIGGCAASALSLAGVAASGFVSDPGLFRAAVFALGVSNGAFAVAAIGSMMGLAGTGAALARGHADGALGRGASHRVRARRRGSDAVRRRCARVRGDAARRLHLVFALEAALFLVAAVLAYSTIRSDRPYRDRNPAMSAQRRAFGATMRGSEECAHDGSEEIFDFIVVGGGPAGATAANDLASRGHKVALLDRRGRIKPCGGAIPPRLISDFAHPELIFSRRGCSLATMISPKGQVVDMPIDGGFVGMVDRDEFDEWLRARAEKSGAVRFAGRYEKITRDGDGLPCVHFHAEGRRLALRISQGRAS